MNPKIYYVMDTMCGWCYGFSEVISQIYDKYRNDVSFTVLPAGMWVGEDVKKMNSSLSNFMRTHNATITKLTGKEFGAGFEQNILQNNNYLLDSLPGAKAVTVMQILQKDRLFEYIKQIYYAFYVQGENMNEWQLYAKLAANLGIDEEAFVKAYFADEQGKRVQDGFATARKLGVFTYPSIVAVTDGKTELISQGLKTFSELDTVFAKLAGHHET